MSHVESNGKCVIFSAPSGAGKTTIVHYLLNEFPEFTARHSGSFVAFCNFRQITVDTPLK
jgi:guanylate kinase